MVSANSSWQPIRRCTGGGGGNVCYHMHPGGSRSCCVVSVAAVPASADRFSAGPAAASGPSNQALDQGLPGNSLRPISNSERFSSSAAQGRCPHRSWLFSTAAASASAPLSARSRPASAAACGKPSFPLTVAPKRPRPEARPIPMAWIHGDHRIRAIGPNGMGKATPL